MLPSKLHKQSVQNRYSENYKTLPATTNKASKYLTSVADVEAIVSCHQTCIGDILEMK